jgi:hypothetical protein
VQVIDHHGMRRDLKPSELRRIGQAIAPARRRPPKVSDDGLARLAGAVGNL